jgi:hypothetical protein
LQSQQDHQLEENNPEIERLKTLVYQKQYSDKPTNLFQDYKPGAYSVYSKQIKYPKDSMSNKESNESLGLVYSSDSFNNINSGIISAVLIYKIIK